MRQEEEAVGQALVDFLGGPAIVSASEGEDPPDLCLTFGTSRVGVEVTRLSQFTFEDGGRLAIRATHDAFGLRLIERLNKKIGPRLLDETSLMVGLWLPVKNAARFEKGVTSFLSELCSNRPIAPQEQEIEGAEVRVAPIPRQPEKAIVGYVVSRNSSPDILLNCRLILEDRIRTKSAICEKLEKPIWLALLNDYWLADPGSFQAAAEGLSLSHCFQRVFIVTPAGKVTELSMG